MRTHRLLLCALAAVLAGSAAGAVAVSAAPHATAPELVDLSVRPSAVSVAALPAGQGFAAAYDDRLTAQGLHYAERRGATWHVATISADIAGRRVGREPSLAISPTGLRLLAFRTDLPLKAGTPPNGVMYVARSFPGHPWFIEQLDVNAFGETTAFDRDGKPAIAYLVRLDTSDAVEVRLARMVNGVWQITKLEATTYRQSVNGANASRVGLAFDAKNRPWVSFVDARSRSLRIVTPGSPSRRIGTVPATTGQTAITFGPAGAAAVVATGLARDAAGVYVGTRSGTAWRVRKAASGVATAPAIVGWNLGLPLIGYRDGIGVLLAQPTDKRVYRTERLLSQFFGNGSNYDGALGIARSRNTLGFALVAPRGLLEFASATLGGT
jgi:hypothetical protein